MRASGVVQTTTENARQHRQQTTRPHCGHMFSRCHMTALQCHHPTISRTATINISNSCCCCCCCCRLGCAERPATLFYCCCVVVRDTRYDTRLAIIHVTLRSVASTHNVPHALRQMLSVIGVFCSVRAAKSSLMCAGVASVVCVQVYRRNGRLGSRDLLFGRILVLNGHKTEHYIKLYDLITRKKE